MRKQRHRVDLIVEIDGVPEPITGRVIDDRGQRRSFSGWLDLMEVLDDVRQDVDAMTSGHAGTGGAHDGGGATTGGGG